MNDVFENRVRAAAVAGWWTLLIAVGFITLLMGHLPRRHGGPPPVVLPCGGRALTGHSSRTFGSGP